MKSDLVLLLTRDFELEQEAAMAAAASGARLMLAGTVGEALEIIAERPGELDLVVIDFDNGTRGTALLKALSTSPAELPVVALTSTDRDHSTVLAYADGAACCLTKPMNAAELEMVIRVLGKKCAKIRNSRSATSNSCSEHRVNPNPKRARQESQYEHNA